MTKFSRLLEKISVHHIHRTWQLCLSYLLSTYFRRSLGSSSIPSWMLWLGFILPIFKHLMEVSLSSSTLHSRSMKEMTPPKSNSVSISKCSKYKKSEHKRLGSPPCPPTNTLRKKSSPISPGKQPSGSCLWESTMATPRVSLHTRKSQKKTWRRETEEMLFSQRPFFIKFRIHLAIRIKVLFSLKFPQWLRNYFQISTIFSRKSRSSSTAPVYSKNLTTVMNYSYKKLDYVQVLFCLYFQIQYFPSLHCLHLCMYRQHLHI